MSLTKLIAETEIIAEKWEIQILDRETGTWNYMNQYASENDARQNLKENEDWDESEFGRRPILRLVRAMTIRYVVPAP